MSRHPVLTTLAALASGIVFGVGLAVSQMTDPEKVKNFLDFAAIPQGGWDPSLAFVMGGAVIVTFIGLRLRRPAGMAIPAQVTPPRRDIDRQLVGGSAVFGVGWGLSGFCPGPAIADLGLVPESVLLFVVAMLVGSWLTGSIRDAWHGGGPAAAASGVAR